MVFVGLYLVQEVLADVKCKVESITDGECLNDRLLPVIETISLKDPHSDGSHSYKLSFVFPRKGALVPDIFCDFSHSRTWRLLAGP